jgi:RNase P subunit RPR2
MNIVAVLHCLHCDGTLIPNAGGGNRHERRAVCTCDGCGTRHILTARLSSEREWAS